MKETKHDSKVKRNFTKSGEKNLEFRVTSGANGRDFGVKELGERHGDLRGPGRIEWLHRSSRLGDMRVKAAPNPRKGENREDGGAGTRWREIGEAHGVDDAADDDATAAAAL